MKRFKKLLAMMLAVVLAVGAVNLPAKEAKAANQQATLSYKKVGLNNNLKRYDISFDVTGGDIGGSMWNGNTVYVDGVAKSGSGVNYAYSSGVLTLYLEYEHVESQKETWESIGKHSLVIKKGTVIGNTEITADVAVVINSGNLTAATPIRLSYQEGLAHNGNGRYQLQFKVFGREGDLTNSYWSNNTAYIDDAATTSGINYSVGEITTDLSILSMFLGYTVLLPTATVAHDLSAFHLKIKAGTVFGNSSSTCMVSLNTVQLDIDQYEITEVPMPEDTVSLADDPSRNQNGSNTTGFYFFGSPIDHLPYANSPSYSMTTGGIYRNDEVLLTAKLMKVASNLYYVSLGVTSGSLTSGDLIKIDGMVKHEGYLVQYEPQTFEYDGNGNWSIYVPTTAYTPSLSPTAASPNGIHLTSTDDVPYDSKWSYNYYTVADEDNGIWVDDSNVSNKVWLKKIAADTWYVVLSDNGYTAQRGTRVTLKGTFTYTDTESDAKHSVTFNETKYIYDGHQWHEGDTLDTNFEITGIGTCEEVGGWKLRFTTDNEIDGTDFETEIGNYTVDIAGTPTEISAYAATGYGLGLYIPDGLVSSGTIVQIPAGSIGEYHLTKAYQIIYDADTWKEYKTPIDTTLSFSHWMGENTKNLIYRASNISGVATTNWGFTASYADSGVFLNGQKVDGANIDYYAQSEDTSLFYVNYGDFQVPIEEDDIVTVKGTFNHNDVYLSFTETSARYNDGTWESSCNYDNFVKTGVKNIIAGWQEYQNQDQSWTRRWLVRMETNVPVEDLGTNYSGGAGMFSGKVVYTVTKPDGTAERYTTTSLYHAIENGKGGYLGIIVPSEQIPSAEEASGYKLVINTALVVGPTKVYRINESYTYVYNKSGTWLKESSRPDPSGVVGDASGNGTFGSEDLVRIMKELGKVDDVLSTDDGLLDGKSKATQFDKIRIYEMLLQGSVEVDGNGVALGSPIYLQDEYIQLAAYMGPRSQERDNRYDDDGKLLSYTKQSFLTETEFKRYADAGLNTLIAEGDASYSSIGENGMESGGGHWSRIAEYMNLAKDAGLDVYLSSNALNEYLGGKTTTTGTNGGTKQLTEEFIKTELNEMLYGIQNYGRLNGYEYTGVTAWDNFKGIQLGDELTWGNRNYFVNANDIIKGLNPDVEVLVSMLAANAGSDKVGSDYKKYAQYFGENSLSRKFSYNYYPFQADATKNGWLFPTYTYDMNNVKGAETKFLTYLQNSALYAQEGGFDTGVTVQSFGMEHHGTEKVYRCPDTEEQIGFQVYSALAYGVKSIDYFTYWEHYNQDPELEVHTGAMVAVDSNGNVTETDTYRAVQAVNNKILQFDHVFLDYDWQTTITNKVSGGSSHVDQINSGSYSRVNSFSATTDALLGCMRDSDKGFDGFWLVNAEDPMSGSTTASTMTVEFKHADQVMVYAPTRGIYGQIVDLSDGAYTTTIVRGAAEFVIPIKLAD